MRDKILKQYTQVPDHLYVKRKADDQIKRIISDMLKPGYVSVSRQMGKTNLLQYAQRSLQSAEQIITYIDVTSADYDTVQDYFNYIVDTILETNPDCFSKSRETIHINRKKAVTAPATEYQKELRSMLKEFNGKIIIILDEVDSLVKYEFSDQIFAQIRSGYFMKNTFKEFERISYILSGVIEPTRLIKSKENSPFNIALKIFLDDFTREEFNSFINKCNLFLDNTVTDRVFHWTNGNPRMTYDICSEIEDILIANDLVTVKDVDNVVESLYLSRYDQAPIDHIRDLLTNNATLRNAVSDIRNKINVSDDIKSQLYLYGVINSNFDNPQLKNIIVDKALSEEWITNINIQNRGMYIYGLECINNEKYLEAIKVFDKLIKEDPTSANISYAKYYLGVSYKEVGDYKKSNEYLEAEPITLNSSNKALYRTQFTLVGTNYWYLGDLETAELYYNKAVEMNLIDSDHLVVLLNLSAIFDRKGLLEKAKNANQDVIDKLENNKDFDKEERDHLLCMSYFNLGKVEEKEKNTTDALDYYAKAILYADHKEKATIHIRQYFNLTEEAEKVQAFENAITLIVKNKIVNQEAAPVHTMHLDLEDFDNLLIFSFVERNLHRNFDLLLNYASENIYKSDKDFILSKIASKLADIGYFNEALELYSRVVTETLNSDIKRKGLLYLSLIGRHLNKPYFHYFKQYHSFYRESSDSYVIDSVDTSTYLSILLNLRERGDNKNIITYAYDLEVLLERDFKDLMYDRSLLQFILADAHFKLENRFEAKRHAIKCLERIISLEKNINSYKDVNKETLLYMKSQAQYISSPSNIKKQKTIYSNRPSRNDIVTVKYANGDTKTGKFKAFEYDVDNDRCVVLSVMS